MKLTHRFVLPALSLAVAVALHAQTTTTTTTPRSGPRGHGGPGGPGFRGHPVIRALDANDDGIIGAAEIANAAKSLLTLDTDADGKLSIDELRPKRPADAPTPPADAPTPPADRPAPPTNADGTHPHPSDPLMLALDADGDGALSAAEIANAPKSLLALDLNHDGQLTPDELRPLPPENPPAN